MLEKMNFSKNNLFKIETDFCKENINYFSFCFDHYLSKDDLRECEFFINNKKFVNVMPSESDINNIENFLENYIEKDVYILVFSDINDTTEKQEFFYLINYEISE